MNAFKTRINRIYLFLLFSKQRKSITFRKEVSVSQANQGFARSDVVNLDKLSEALDEQQKKNKVRNLIYAVANRDKTIVNKGSSVKSKWVLAGNTI